MRMKERQYALALWMPEEAERRRIAIGYVARTSFDDDDDAKSRKSPGGSVDGTLACADYSRRHRLPF